MAIRAIIKPADGPCYASFEEPDGLRFHIRRMPDGSLQARFPGGNWEPTDVYPQLDVDAIEYELRYEL